MEKINYLAVDLGATSGRTIVASFDGKRVEMRELTRFKNPMIPIGGHLFWDLPHLYREIVEALKQVAEENIKITSIGIDSWGCDFAFFDVSVWMIHCCSILDCHFPTTVHPAASSLFTPSASIAYLASCEEQSPNPPR